ATVALNSECRSGLTRHQISDKESVSHQRCSRCRNSFIVPSKSSKARSTDAIGGQIDNVRSVTKAFQLLGREEAASGKCGLGAIHAIEFGRMAAGLVNLKRQLRAAENQGRVLARA